MDETYIKVKGVWDYLYRAVDTFECYRTEMRLEHFIKTVDRVAVIEHLPTRRFVLHSFMDKLDDDN